MNFCCEVGHEEMINRFTAAFASAAMPLVNERFPEEKDLLPLQRLHMAYPPEGPLPPAP